MTASPPSVPTGPVDTEPTGFYARDAQAAVLRETLTASGVDLGAYDLGLIDWLAGWEWGTVAVIIAWVARAAQSREPAPAVALPGRFDATPAEVDQHLRRILAEDVYLRFQQTIGGLVVAEAAKDVRMEVVAPGAPDTKEWREVADYIDPGKGGNPYPSHLQCSQRTGFGPCPGAPDCTPRETTKDDRARLTEGGA
ncbi:hypothetical protein [Streptomyces bungoensis]|uniref:hypothetical protein n=1 Tax=Streptomyces bungoensis TaxID=285568 RepID=UPI003416A02F